MTVLAIVTDARILDEDVPLQADAKGRRNGAFHLFSSAAARPNPRTEGGNSMLAENPFRELLVTMALITATLSLVFLT